LDGRIFATNADPTPLLYPINDIAFAVRENDDEHRYVCYAGTETGVSLCLLVHLETHGGSTVDEGKNDTPSNDQPRDGVKALDRNGKRKSNGAANAHQGVAKLKPATGAAVAIGEASSTATNSSVPAVKPIITKQLWRDLHDSPVIAVRPTKKPGTSHRRNRP